MRMGNLNDREYIAFIKISILTMTIAAFMVFLDTYSKHTTNYDTDSLNDNKPAYYNNTYNDLYVTDKDAEITKSHTEDFTVTTVGIWNCETTKSPGLYSVITIFKDTEGTYTWSEVYNNGSQEAYQLKKHGCYYMSDYDVNDEAMVFDAKNCKLMFANKHTGIEDVSKWDMKLTRVQ